MTTASVTPLELVKLPALMALSSGSSDIAVALMDGPVATSHPELTSASIREVAGGQTRACMQPQSSACAHGTFVAGILAARRGSPAPAICPDCTLFVRPIFRESADNGNLPMATSEEVAEAIVECVNVGARVLNLSAAMDEPSTRAERRLQEALDYAARRGVLVVVAAGNQGTIGSSAITRHSWVIPVVAYDSWGRPMNQSNLGSSLGRRGLGAAGEDIESIGAEGRPLTLGGTSFAAAFVTGTIALLWSIFPATSAAEMRHAMTNNGRRATVAPPLLDAWAVYEMMRAVSGNRR
jgi:subtilisin family serine protease